MVEPSVDKDEQCGNSLTGINAPTANDPGGPTRRWRLVLGDVSNRRRNRSMEAIVRCHELIRKRENQSKERDMKPSSSCDNEEKPADSVEERKAGSSRNDKAQSRPIADRTRSKDAQKTICAAVAEKKNQDEIRPRKRCREPDDQSELFMKILRDQKLNVASICQSYLRTRPQRRDFSEEVNHTMACASFDASKYTSGRSVYDMENRGDALHVTDYVADIFQRLYVAETHCRPEPYMHKQKDINASMRMILVDWIIEVHQKFRLEQETLHLCVNILDRFLALVEIDRSRLQLVGVTALLIASKYEEIYPPQVKDCVYITDRAYTHQQILDMERQILQVLRFKVAVPTAHPFLRRFLCIAKATPTMRTAAAYYLDRILQEHDLLKFRPSLVAAAAVTLSLNHPEIREFDGVEGAMPGVPNALMSYTGYSRDIILQAAELMSRKIAQVTVVTESRRELYAVKRKYQSEKHYFISVEFGTPDSFVDDLLAR